MQVTLLHNTPLEIADIAIGKCWDKPSAEGTVNCERIERVANKNKHASTIEHITYNFDVKGVSRALLQEQARHRIASYSVKSTRYTLKELKDCDEFGIDDFKSANKYIVLTGNKLVDSTSIMDLNNLRVLLINGISNDIAKYALPECYKTEYTFSINARALQNFLQLRNSKSALWEIRELAKALYDALPEDHKFLYKEIMNG